LSAECQFDSIKYQREDSFNALVFDYSENSWNGVPFSCVCGSAKDVLSYVVLITTSRKKAKIRHIHLRKITLLKRA